MAARNTRFRALNADFRSFMDDADAWPTIGAILLRLGKIGGGRRADIVAMKKGSAVPEKCVRALAEVLTGNKALVEFWARTNTAPADEGRTQGVVDHISGPVLPHATSVDSEDWHLKGIDGLVGVFTDFIWRNLIPPGTLCKNESDVSTAVDMIMAATGRQAASDLKLEREDAIKQAEYFMQISRDEYLRKVLDRWHAAKWTIAFATVDRRRVACSHILPLTEQSYEQIKAGNRCIHSYSSRDLAMPSCSLFLEAVSHRSDREYPSVSKKTSQAVRTIFVQLAAMSMGEGQRFDGRGLRILSMSGTRISDARLRRSGFQPTGTKMQGFDIEIMEMSERKAWWIPLVVGKLQERLLSETEQGRR